MSIKFTKYHEFDPGIEYEILPNPLVPEEVHCCKCVEGDLSLCQNETSFGAFATTAAAHTVAYWYA